MEIALKNTALTGSLADDRTAIRDAIANVKGYEGLASGQLVSVLQQHLNAVMEIEQLS